MKRVFSINVPGQYGYSFAVEGELNEGSAISKAFENGLFEEPIDANYAVAEDITDSDYDLKAFENCTYKV